MSQPDHTKHISKSRFERIASTVVQATGSTAAFTIAISIIVIWALLGPAVDFSEKWQFAIHTFTSIISFLMVFLIQKTVNKDALATQLKLNEVIAATNASNRLVNIEGMTEEEMKIIQKYYSKLAAVSEKEEGMHEQHSIDEDSPQHQLKEEMDREIQEINKQHKT